LRKVGEFSLAKLAPSFWNRNIFGEKLGEFSLIKKTMPQYATRTSFNRLLRSLGTTNSLAATCTASRKRS
jgi:hypothetical protein